jgi:phage tail sheath gpL-like
VDIGALARDVTMSLRPEHIVVTPPVVNAILLAYVTEVEALAVVQVSEGY